MARIQEVLTYDPQNTYAAIKYEKKDIPYIENNPTVFYHNDFYNFVFTDFNAIDYNFLITLFYLFKEKKNLAIQINTLFLASFMNKKFYNKKRMIREFKAFSEKVMKVYIKTHYQEKTSYFNLFNHIHIDEKRGNFYIALDQNIIDIINNINTFYTKFFIKEFYALDGKYSKIFYLLFISFKNKGCLKISKDNLYKYLDLSSSYERKDNFEKRVLRPALQELEEKGSFSNLMCEEIKDENNEIAFIFHFEKEKI